VPLRTDLSKGVAVRPEELNKFFRPLLACIVLRLFSFGFEVFWYVFWDLEPADLGDVSLLSGSFVSPVINQLDTPL
jgi:hypothetical protein